MATQEKREQRLQMLEDHIGRALAESEQSGELRSARGWGQPLDFGDGYNDTPPELRMGFKLLKDAGVVPHEVSLMHDIAALREQIQNTPDHPETPSRRQALLDKQQQLALRLEKLRISGSL